MLDTLKYQHLCNKNVTGDTVNLNGTVRYTACLHNRLICHHNIDRVNNNKHNRAIIVVLAQYRIASL